MRIQDMGLGLDSNLPLDERRIGIEVEVERCTDAEKAYRHWINKEDPSLREGGREWITIPIRHSEVTDRLADLYSDFDEFNWDANTRTGIHVHIDVRDFTTQQLQALAMAYCLVERALCILIGEGREENIYCVPWYRAPGEAQKVMKCLTDPDPRTGIRRLESTVKYAGLYFEPIRRFGTVEFRHAPTWDSAEPTQRWVDTCFALVEYAAQRGTAQAVYEEFDQLGDAAAFAFNVCGIELPNPKAYNEWHATAISESIALMLLDVVEPPDADQVAWKRLKPVFDEAVMSQAAEMLSAAPTMMWVDDPMMEQWPDEPEEIEL
jgi:hypothetical protein